MNEMSDGRSRCVESRRALPAPSSPLSSPSCQSTQTWPSSLHPPSSDHQMDHGTKESPSQIPPPPFYEELFFPSQTPTAPIPLAAAFVSCSGPQGDVVKQGYLGKLESNHRRYFALRAGSHTGPSRLEWYKSREKFTAMEKSAGKTPLFGMGKQGVIFLRCCLGVSWNFSSSKGHTLALYAKNHTMVLVFEDQREQDEWYLAIKKLMEEEQRDENGEEGFDEEDDGYCTLPPAAILKEVWPVTVKPRGLGRSKSLAGEARLCLSVTSLILVKVGVCNDMPSVTLPLLSVRRFGHSDGLFFLELGRSAPTGPGEIWMEARDRGNPALTQHMHEVVWETVRALRALPDFSQSPISYHIGQNHPPALLASKRSRHKYRERQGQVRPLASPLFPISRSPGQPEILTSPSRCPAEPCGLDKPEPGSPLSPLGSQQNSTLDTGSYMDMRMDHPVLKLMEDNASDGIALATGDHGSVPANRMKGWETGEEEGPGYMLMSPQPARISAVLPQDDYVTMRSPRTHTWPVSSSSSSSLQTSIKSSSNIYIDSVQRSHHQTSESVQLEPLVSTVHQSEPAADQSQMVSISHSTQAQIHAILTAEPVQANAIRSGPDQSNVRRFWLSSCLPSCLQAEQKP